MPCSLHLTLYLDWPSNWCFGVYDDDDGYYEMIFGPIALCYHDHSKAQLIAEDDA